MYHKVRSVLKIKDQRSSPGLAYGYLAGVPPIHGLYTSIYLSLLYVVFGSSKHAAPGETTVIPSDTVPPSDSGAFAIIAMMVGTVVEDVLTSSDVVLPRQDSAPGFCCSPKGGAGRKLIGC